MADEETIDDLDIDEQDLEALENESGESDEEEGFSIFDDDAIRRETLREQGEAIEDEETEATEAEGDDEAQPEEEAEEEEESGFHVSLGSDDEEDEEAESEKATPLVNTLRKRDRKQTKRIKELEKQLSQYTTTEKPPVLGAKPRISDPSIDYDQEKFEAAIDNWYAQKAKVDAAKEEQESKAAAQRQAQQQRHEAYIAAKAKINVKDFEIAEESVIGALSNTQQGVILEGADNPALFVYALGKNPRQLDAIAAIKDP